MSKLKKGIKLINIQYGTSCIIAKVEPYHKEIVYKVMALEEGGWHPGYFTFEDLIIYYRFENRTLQLLYGK